MRKRDGSDGERKKWRAGREREKDGLKDRKRERGQETETGRNREHRSLTSMPLETGEKQFLYTNYQVCVCVRLLWVLGSSPFRISILMQRLFRYLRGIRLGIPRCHQNLWHSIRQDVWCSCLLPEPSWKSPKSHRNKY